MKGSKIVHWLIGLFVLSVLASACTFTRPVAAPASSTAEPVELNVSAALGLKEALLDIQRDYEAKHPNVKIIYNLAAAGSLEKQIEQGAPADIFISAANKQMDDLQQKNLINTATRINLVSSKLVLIAPKESLLGLTSFKDLTKDSVKKYGLGAPESVPAGQYGIEVLKAMGIWDEVKDKAVLTKDVKTILTHVETGNIEAGIVSSTVAATSDKVKVVAIAPEGTHEPIVFPAAVLTNAKQPKDAAEFIHYLTSPEAMNVFKKYGWSAL